MLMRSPRPNNSRIKIGFLAILCLAVYNTFVTQQNAIRRISASLSEFQVGVTEPEKKATTTISESTTSFIAASFHSLDATVSVPPTRTNITVTAATPHSPRSIITNNVTSGEKIKPEATAVVSVNGTLLPSAKSLLTKPPPYQDSQIIKLADTLISSPNTIVTAYFRIPSKHGASRYFGWMKNILSIQDAMVIFTEPDLVDTMRELRKHALNRTVIIQMEITDLPIGTLYTEKFWETQWYRDPERMDHKSPLLFWIWLSKSWWTMEAIRHNFFQSDLFFYSDMGCFRNQQYNGKTLILHRDQVPPHEMIQMAHHEPNPPAQRFFNDKYKHASNFYHSGSQMAAYVDTWKKFHEYFLDTIDGFLVRKMAIVEDQAILQSVCLRFPDICAYVPFEQVKQDNHYFGLRYVLHYGGNFKLWRYHPSTAAMERS
jgi:hypothetical protein